jgi:hypothetical protein
MRPPPSVPLLLLVFAVGFTAPGQEPPPNMEQVQNDEQELKAAGIPIDSKGLLAYFRERTLPNADRPRVAELIGKLGAESFEVRERALKDLVAGGPRVVGMLRQAARRADPEVAGGAKECLRRLREQANPALTATAVRVLARQKPPGPGGAVAVLLAYSPCADDETVAAAVRGALAFLAVRDGKVDPALVRGLTDADAAQRAAAGEALCQAGVESERPAVRRLLQDPDPEVRRRVGLALAGVNEKAAVPALIDLLPDLSGEEFWYIDDLLCRLAGDHAPAVPLGQDAAGRRKYRDAWAEWWRAAGAGLDLAKLDVVPRPASSTLLVVTVPGDRAGEILELGPGGKERWRLTVPSPVAAELLPGDRVLVAEYGEKRVTVRNFQGELDWEKQMPQPVLAAQRLPDGHTFIACRNQLVEVDRDGKEVFRHGRRVRDVIAARKLPSGPAALVTHDGLCVWVDAAGKEMKSFPVVKPRVMGAGIDVLPNRRVLVPDLAGDRVVEYDCEGNAVWQVLVRAPTSARRLPNGHTVVASTTHGEVVELDRGGNVVWRHQDVEGVVQASRR